MKYNKPGSNLSVALRLLRRIFPLFLVLLGIWHFSGILKELPTGPDNQSISYLPQKLQSYRDARDKPMPLSLYTDAHKYRPLKCPEKYIYAYPYSQLGNGIMQLIRLLTLGGLLNRTVVLEPAYGFLGRFDLSQFCVTDDRKMLQRTVEHADMYTYMFDREDDYWDNIPIVQYRVPERFLQGKDGKVRMGAILDVLPAEPNPTKLILWSNIFFALLPESYSMEILSKIKFLPPVIAEGERFIKDVLKTRDFVAIHSRNLDGECYDFASKCPSDDTRAQCKQICDMPYEYIRSLFKVKGVDIASPDTTVYFASDGQREDIDGEWNKKGVVRYKGSDGAPERRLVEMYILSQSAWFLTHPWSTFGAIAAHYRVINGRSMDSNVWQSYEGTKFYVNWIEKG